MVEEGIILVIPTVGCTNQVITAECLLNWYVVFWRI